MQNYFFELSPLAAAYFSALLFFGNRDRIGALIFAVAVHEISHLLALSFFGCRISSVKLRLNGLCICYSDNGRSYEVFFSHMAGPVGGLLFPLLGKFFPTLPVPEWLTMSYRMSLYLAFFNLLPVCPLDGGYALKTLLASHLDGKEVEKVIRNLGLGASVLLMLAGLICVMKNSGFGISLAGVWILCANISVDDL